ncbi:MAG TPA: zinc-ribbon domain-containing protein [Pyrinomonadaceae bacterium]|nr:zinc-ribbon domain-containing protein [Pyrinomonadaceae bacterium]
MLCPNCGTKTTTEHKFCRNCGMNLVPVAHALAAHLSHGGAAAAAAARESERRAVRRMTRGLMAGVIVIVFGILLLLLPSKGFQMLGVLSALIGIVAALAAVFSTLRATVEAPAYTAPHAPDPAAPPTGRLLEEQTFEPVPASVTERTTDLLGVEVKERGPRD